jgi:hypothetical protein
MPTRPRSYNSIHYTYLDDLTDASLSHNAIAVEMYLMLSPSSNMLGIWRESAHTIASALNLTLPEVKEAMSELEFNERATFFSGDWLFLASKWRFDPSFFSPNPKHFQGLINLLKLAPRKAQSAFGYAFPDLSCLISGCIPHESGTLPDNRTRTSTREDSSHGPWLPEPPKPPFSTDPQPAPPHEFIEYEIRKQGY